MKKVFIQCGEYLITAFSFFKTFFTSLSILAPHNPLNRLSKTKFYYGMEIQHQTHLFKVFAKSRNEFQCTFLSTIFLFDSFTTNPTRVIVLLCSKTRFNITCYNSHAQTFSDCKYHLMQFYDSQSLVK